MSKFGYLDGGLNEMTQYSFGGDRISILFSDGRICVRDKSNPEETLSIQPCGATCIKLNGNSH